MAKRKQRRTRKLRKFCVISPTNARAEAAIQRSYFTEQGLAEDHAHNIMEERAEEGVLIAALYIVEVVRVVSCVAETKARDLTQDELEE